MGKKNKRFKDVNQAHNIVISKEEYEKYVAFCQIKDELVSLAQELEEGWNDHCVFLLHEMNLETPIIDSTIDQTIEKLQDALRRVKYTGSKKDKKKNKTWFAPLSGGQTTSYKKPHKYSVHSAKESDKSKEKKVQKSQIVFENLGQTRTLSFETVIEFADDNLGKSIEQLIEEVEGIPKRDFSVCEHGNRHPCEICEIEKYYSVD